MRDNPGLCPDGVRNKISTKNTLAKGLMNQTGLREVQKYSDMFRKRRCLVLSYLVIYRTTVNSIWTQVRDNLPPTIIFAITHL